MAGDAATNAVFGARRAVNKAAKALCAKTQIASVVAFWDNSGMPLTPEEKIAELTTQIQQLKGAVEALQIQSSSESASFSEFRGRVYGVGTAVVALGIISIGVAFMAQTTTNLADFRKKMNESSNSALDEFQKQVGETLTIKSQGGADCLVLGEAQLCWGSRRQDITYGDPTYADATFKTQRFKEAPTFFIGPQGHPDVSKFGLQGLSAELQQVSGRLVVVDNQGVRAQPIDVGFLAIGKVSRDK